MDTSTRFDTQIVGALPVIGAYFEMLEVSKLVDDLVPWEGDVPLGALVEILMANRLLQPKALFRIGQWARKAGLTDYYGVTAEQLNDDRLGRALERLAAHAATIQSALVLKATEVFDLRIDQIHYDISNVELYGAYERQEAEEGNSNGPKPAYGRTKSGRKNVKQIQFGLDVTGDGAVPVGHLPLDGNQAETPTHLDNLKQLARQLPKSKLLYIADSKLDSEDNLLAIAARGGEFLCGGSFLPHLQEQFRRNRDKLRKIDYFPKSQAQRPAAERDQYQAFELMDRISGDVDGRGIRLKYRQVFVWSQSKERQQAKTRERHLAKIREEFESVARNAGKYSLTSEGAIVRRLERAKGKYAIGSVFDYEVKKSRQGKLSLQWRIDEQALAQRQELEGVYVLKTNLAKSSHPTAAVLSTYKEQAQVERRIGDLKGPLAVAPMFLEKPERMAGLLCVLVWSLMVMALMERSVRKNLKGEAFYGLYPENRPSPAPTGRALLECFSTVCIVIVREQGKTYRRLADLTSVQRQLVNLLGIPPNFLRTFKRRCGM